MSTCCLLLIVERKMGSSVTRLFPKCLDGESRHTHASIVRPASQVSLVLFRTGSLPSPMVLPERRAHGCSRGHFVSLSVGPWQNLWGLMSLSIDTPSGRIGSDEMKSDHCLSGKVFLKCKTETQCRLWFGVSSLSPQGGPHAHEAAPKPSHLIQ